MRPLLILGLAALAAGACKDASGPNDRFSRGVTAGLVLGTPSVSILDALGAATPTTHFSVFGSGGSGISGGQFSGPEFILTEPTTITEIGGFLNNCKSIVSGIPQCPGTLPFIVQIRPSTNGVPDASTVLASFPLSHDDNPLVWSYESVAINLTLGPGRYFALFAPQGADAGSLLTNATDPFDYSAGDVNLGFFNPLTGISTAESDRGAVRIVGNLATPQAALQLLMDDVRSLISEGVLSQDQGDGLLDKLTAAIPSLDRGRSNAACNQLGAFVNQASGFVRAGKLPVEMGQDLIEAAESVRTQIGCAPPAPIPPILLAMLSQDHTCALAQGMAYCWGGNSNGQLGDGTTTSSSVPVKVMTQVPFSALIEGGSGTYGLAGGQQYYTWGLTAFATSSTTPVPNQDLTAMSFSQLATGFNFACGLAPDHLAYCWGNNERGQLGDGTTAARYVIGPPVGSGLQFVSLSSSSSSGHMCGLTAAGKAYCWGSNTFGELGDGTKTDRLSPVAVATSLSFVELAAGFFHTCARTAGDEVYCWGTMDPGPSIGPTPTLIGQEPPLVGIIGGLGAGCVLTATGEARCWGYNGWGTLGDGTWTNRTTPTAVAGGLNFASLSMGAGHVCGVTHDDQIYCWGFNAFGQVGDGTTINQNTPQPVQLPGTP